MKKPQNAVKVSGAELAAAGRALVASIVETGADFQERTIYLVGGVDWTMAHRFMATMSKMDRSDGRIRVVLMSEGGSEPAGFAIYDTIREARNVVMIDGYGAVYSMAALIMQAGSIRRLAPQARYMLHAGVARLGEAIDQRTVISAGIEARQLNRNYIQLIADRCNLPFRKVWRLWNKELYLTAKQALALNLIDDIIPYVQDKK